MWKDFLSFNRSQQRGIIVLGMLLFVLLVLRTVVSFGYPAFELNAQQKLFLEQVKQINDSLPVSVKEDSLFEFDPNLMSEEDMVLLGLTPYQRKSLIGYRNKIGRIDSLGELYKVYGFDSLIIDKIREFAVFSPKKKVIIANEERVRSTIDINTAKADDFKKLKGIGDVLSKRIVKYRKLLGGFYKSEQLKEVYGLPLDVYEDLSGRFEVNANLVQKMNIDSCSWRDIAHHPYFTKNDAFVLLKLYKKYGVIGEDIEGRSKGKITDESWQKMKPYILNVK